MSMRRLLSAAVVTVGAALIYLFTWPVPIEPQAWSAPEAPELTGVYAVNSRLAGFESMAIDDLHGPEAVVTDANGNGYATTHEGWIIRWAANNREAKRWVDAGGRPLGLDLGPDGNLWVANAYLGLQRIDPAGNLVLETDTADGVAIRYADDVVVSRAGPTAGKVYFSDASTRFAAEDAGGTLQASLLDIMEHVPNGRILEFDPVTRTTRTIMRELSFANGVTMDPEGQFLLVCETGSYRIWKHWLAGPNAGTSEVIADNLPGFPDNIHRGLNGRYWVGLTSPRSALLDGMDDQPWKRRLTQRLPAFMRPSVVPYGHVLAIDADGRVLLSLQDPAGAYPATTGAWETEQYLYVSSLIAPVLARYTTDQVGLGEPD